jgi:3-methyladenine DNA glycosylase AlkC
MSLEERLIATERFAADHNMSVREVAWMAFRPHLALRLELGLQLLHRMSRHRDQNIRRFAIEVSRPRSVWGAHITALKHSPELALPLLEAVRQDGVKYVQLSAGNWLNDASKTRPAWVRELCSLWMEEPHPATAAIVRRGLRTVSKSARKEIESSAWPVPQATG